MSDEVFWRKDGSSFPIEYWSYPIIKNGKVEGSVLTFLDISERIAKDEEIRQKITLLRQQQDLLNEITTNIDEVIWLLTPDWREVLYVSSAYEKIWGRSCQDLIDNPLEWLQFVHPEDRERVEEEIVGRALKDDSKWEFSEYRIIRPNGEIRWLSARSYPIRDDKGEIIRYAGVARDVTARKIAEEELHQALCRAEEANQAKSDFMATMSHDLRTPLNAIMGFSEMMCQRVFGELGSAKYQEYAEDILSSSQYLLSLVNNILDLSTIEAGERVLAKEKLELKDIVDECCTIIHKIADEKGIECLMDVSEDLPLIVADRQALKQILINILSNSVKFTPSGGKIEFSAQAANGFHIIKISDTGKGIPNERLDQITSPFVIGELDPHMAREGSGLGLAIVKSLVKIHGGELDISSTVGKGTTVTVTLPSDPD